jgi:nucleotide-binding universal stress UspA family protein
MKIDRIVVGLDGSPRAPGVLDAAVSLANEHGAKLVVVRAVGVQAHLPPEVLSVRPDDVPALLEKAEARALEGQLSGLPTGLVAETVVELGSPADVVCATARRVNADLVVVGSHGYRGLDHVLGTTAARVANTAPCSVLVVRPAAR